ncbi:MAG: trypsin-like peptidase domain-containing protein [Planctomycetes bacterium]|nr:trypsin-like peptidase domain-containing protein [Planctomycetota bacterium]
MITTAILSLILGSVAQAPAAAPAANGYASIVERVAPSIVTVNFVIRMDISMMGQSQSEEIRSAVAGVAVANDMVAVSLTALDPAGSSPFADQMDIKATPVSLRVVFGNSDKDLEAELAAKDPKLGLAFLKVKELGETKVQPLTTEDAPSAGLGDEFIVVNRLSKNFDYAPHFQRGLITGTIEKPRRAYIIQGGSTLGLPAFDSAGRLIGILSSVDAGDDSDQGIGAMLLGDDFGPRAFILPAKVFRKSIERARAGETAPEETEGDK